MADALGVTFQQVQKYERGANRVSASKLVRIARALSIGPSAFLGEGEDASTQQIWQFREDEVAVLHALRRLSSCSVKTQLRRLIEEMAKVEEDSVDPAAMGTD